MNEQGDNLQRPGNKANITIYLVNGKKVLGTILGFDANTTMMVTRGAHESEPRPGVLHVSPEQTAAVALGPGAGDLPEKPRTIRPFEAHLSGGQVLVLLCDPSRLDDKLGYWAWPENPGPDLVCYWIYHHGVVTLVDRKRLGSLLLNTGTLEQDQLEKGLDVQQKQRGTLIGEILREQGVDGGAIEQAARFQQNSGPGRIRLGEVLMEAGTITRDQLERALEEQRLRRGKRLGQILVELGLTSERAIIEALAIKFNLPFLDLDQAGIDPTVMSRIPRELALKYQILPVAMDGDELVVALADPLAFEGVDLLRFSTGIKVRKVLASPSRIARELTPDSPDPEQLEADDLEDLTTLLEQADEEPATGKPTEAQATTVQFDEDTGVVKLLNHIIIDAVHRGASDIHIEPNGPNHETLVRLRIDGRCEVAWRLSPEFRSQLVARIKVMSKLDITERRKPQDGKIKFRFRDQKVELRIATIPVFTADEDVVMRILAQGKPIPVDQMQFSPRNYKEILRAIHNPHGMILVVGPTGSGKTTTLHSLMAHINDSSRKIWTAEDPVEISQPGLRQVQVNPRTDFTFANALRAFLRADPDIIMVGEMRDQETVSIGIEAALTGHLVFSTLHTNSAAETVTRLMDMGMNPLLFGDELQTVLAQRLARRLCPHCKERYTPSQGTLTLIRSSIGEDAWDERFGNASPRLWRAVGCHRCAGKGYKGRIAIHELMVNNEELKSAIQRAANVSTLNRLAAEGGMRTLLQDGLEKMLQGFTDLSEVRATCFI